jgi:thioredoxin 1
VIGTHNPRITMHIVKLLAAAAAAAVVAVPAQAGEIRAFDNSVFQADQTQNRPVVIWVHAPWCPVCRAQEKTITQLLATPSYKGVTVLKIDFDTQKPLWTKFGATMQSTLIGFHGRRETGRIAHDADPAKVTQVFASTLG